MKISKRLSEIMKKNEIFEKQSPYNFCDRWCERCAHERQVRCSLYKDDLERKITCIAHGKDEDDPEMTKAIIEAQYGEIDEKLSESIDKFGIDLDDPDIGEGEVNEEDAISFEDLPTEIREHIKFVENNPLDISASNYWHKAHAFLKEAFYENKDFLPELKDAFEVVSWYYTLLSAKLHRALCGFHESFAEDDISLCDAVAQFQVCKKAINESDKALRKIAEKEIGRQAEISRLLALLNNILSRIELLEESI